MYMHLDHQTCNILSLHACQNLQQSLQCLPIYIYRTGQLAIYADSTQFAGARLLAYSEVACLMLIRVFHNLWQNKPFLLELIVMQLHQCDICRQEVWLGGGFLRGPIHSQRRCSTPRDGLALMILQQGMPQTSAICEGETQGTHP